MKKIVFLISMTLGMLNIYGQNEKYTKAMEALVPAVDTTRTLEGLTELAGSFERIANAEKTQWLPYYYAALCNVNMANLYFQMQQPGKIDPVMDKAEPMMKKAEELEKNNADLFLLRKMYNTGRMMADPMSRYMTYLPAANEALETARKLNPENPRIYLLEGIDKFFTPAEYGGSKDEGRKLFQEAIKKFEAYKPASSIHPWWGLGQAKFLMTLP